MAFTRGQYGVEYHQSEAERHNLRGFVVLILVLIGVAFACYKISHWWKARRETADSPKRAPVVRQEAPPTTPAPPPVETQPAVVRPNRTRAEILSASVTPTAAPPPPPPQPKLPPTVRPLVQGLLETEASRPQQDQILIRRYAEAERQGNVRNAVDAIKKLYDRPSMADFRNLLMRRLGDLNFQELFSGKPTIWTKTVVVRRGDGRDRIAREHRTTSAALMKLNPTVKWEKLKPGDKVTVLEFPNAVLVVHKQTNTADLSLRNEKFFRRYDFTVSKSATCGLYPIAPENGETLRARYRELDAKLAPSDRAELDLFMGPGSRITVTEQ